MNAARRSTTAAGPAVTVAPTAAPCTDPRAYTQFVINVHDTVHVDESAATLLRAVALFDKYGVAGDCYLTGPMVRLYSEQQPQVFERLKDSQMTISYHVRPPHPLYDGFDQRLRGFSDTQLKQALQDYETYGLALAAASGRSGSFASGCAVLPGNHSR